jgi:diacylglycerol O-acyltransferase / wax synthase
LCHKNLWPHLPHELATGEKVLITTLSPADSIFFFTESPTQHQHTIGVILLDPSTAPDSFDVGTLIALSEDLVDEAPGFRLKFVDSPAAMGVPMLAEDPDFNFHNHIRHIALPAPGDMDQLSELVADIASRPLCHDIPLWENCFVSGLEGGLIAIISKSHHSLSDGVNGAETMAKMFDLEPNPPKREAKTKPDNGKHATAPTTLEIMRAAINTRRKSPSTVDTVTSAVRGLMRRREVSKQCEHSELLPVDMMKAPKVFFNGQITSRRSVAMGSFSLSDLKTVKNAFGVSLNDAVLAVVAIAVRRYLELHDDLPEDALTCMVPISLSLNAVPDGAGNGEAANQVQTMNVKFPVQIEDPVELIETLHKCSSAAKQRFNDTFDNIILKVVDTLSPQLAGPAMSLMTGGFSARFPMSNLGVSNIPGPNFPLYMRGAKVVGNYPMGPIPNGIGLGITLMSYQDDLYFTAQGCREKTPDIKRLGEFIGEAVIELLEAAGRADTAGKDAAKPARKASARAGSKARKAKPKAKSKAKLKVRATASNKAAAGTTKTRSKARKSATPRRAAGKR